MLIELDGVGRRLPDFLIIGAAKSGTTSLYYYLKQHPSLFFSDIKEPGYLCFAGMRRLRIANGLPDMWQSAVTDLETYVNLFARTPEGALLAEATPEYLLLSERTIGNIRRLYGDHAQNLRFVAILRDPAERIWSHYWMMLRDGYEDLSFAEATSQETIAQRLAAGWHPSYDYLGYGRYGRQVTEYIETFGADRLAVVLFEDLAGYAGDTCKRLFRFLGVDDNIEPEVSVQHNPSGALRYPALHRWLFTKETVFKQVARRALASDRLQALKASVIRWNSRKVEMPRATRERLVSFYADDIARVASLTGRDLGRWLRV